MKAFIGLFLYTLIGGIIFGFTISAANDPKEGICLDPMTMSDAAGFVIAWPGLVTAALIDSDAMNRYVPLCSQIAEESKQ